MAGALLMFVLLIMFYIVIADIITIFFRLAGMTEEKARFQVISLLTNSGFTTQESEAVVNSKIRRRLATATMIFGYAFTVTILSAMFNIFISMSDSEITSVFVEVPLLILSIFIFHKLRKSPQIKRFFDRWIETIGNRIMFGNNSNQVLLVEEYGEMVVAHIYLHKVPEILREVTLAQSGLMTNHQHMVMLVKSNDSEAQQANATTVLRPNDTIMVLGKRKNIREIFERVDS